MKIWQNGTERDRGAKELANESLRRVTYEVAPGEERQPKRIIIWVSGVPGAQASGTHHSYRVMFDPKEFASLIVWVIRIRTADRTARAFGAAITAFVQEIFEEED